MVPEATPAHVADARRMDQRLLMAKYRHEAAEHRRILFGRGSGMDPSWRNFRQFLADMGPAPDDQHVVARVTPGDLTYGPGKCAWLHRDRQPALSAPVQAEPAPARTMGLWASVGGQPVEYGALAKRLGVPFEAMTVALRTGQSPEDLVQQASVADTLVASAGAEAWLPPERERRKAFFTAYRMWHMQVHPRFATAATPAFLYLYSALPGMTKIRDSLVALNLWNPPTEQRRQQRNAHDLWRRYCDSMIRVEAARAEFAIYRQYSLTDEIDDLWARVRQAEARFRAGPRRPSGPAA